MADPKRRLSFRTVMSNLTNGTDPVDFPAAEIAPKVSMPGIEQRKHVRIPVAVPVSCVSIDQEGIPLNFSMAVVKDISQGGLALDVYCELESNLVLLSFVDLSGKSLELRGKSVYSKKNKSGTIKVGVLLLGNPTENIDFVKELVRFHHYTKKSTLTGVD